MNAFESFLHELELDHKDNESLFEAIKGGYYLYHDKNEKMPVNEGLISGFMNLFKKKVNPTDQLMRAIDREFVKVIDNYIKTVGKTYDAAFTAYNACLCDGVFSAGAEMSNSVDKMAKGMADTDTAIVSFQGTMLQLEQNIFKLISKLGKEYDRIDAKEQKSAEQVEQAKELRKQAQEERRSRK